MRRLPIPRPGSGAPAQYGQVVAFGVLTGLGGAVAVAALSYGVWLDEGRVGAGLLPLVLGLLLLLTCGALFAAALRRALTRRSPAPGTDSGTDPRGRTQAERVRNLRVVFALTLAMVAVLPYVGILVAFGGYVTAVATLVERRPWYAALATAAAVVAAVHLVFGVLLGVPLPGWTLTPAIGGAP
ncbi:tripartite tricarboxylate transporter TctB family protein [Marinactinospora rubrisoli]|uniref:Tripartite tricarboxylate transporter TctB family protein n=1 Tax=Marinactinospora rubrisoli TaxID=2715399 RepID=A0ABW2KP23_9ACTN